MLAKSVTEGKGGLRLDFRQTEFLRLRDLHGGIHCSTRFRAAHPAFVKVLSWTVEQHGWRRLKMDSLDVRKSISLVAKGDPDLVKLKKQSLLTLEKEAFVQLLTKKCQWSERSFLVRPE